MTNERFLKEIYEPYNGAYRLLKMIKDCGAGDSEDTWSSFTKMLDDYTTENNSEFGHIMARMVTDAADIIAKMNAEE